MRDLLRNLRGDRVGLVPFAGSSLLQCPLTIDYAAFTMTLDDLYSGILPRGLRLRPRLAIQGLLQPRQRPVPAGELAPSGTRGHA